MMRLQSMLLLWRFFHFSIRKAVSERLSIPAGCEGDVPVFKLSGDLRRAFCCEAELVKCQSEANLSRTQAVLNLKDKSICRDYFLKSQVGNTHVIFTGAQKPLFEAFLL